jgi:hypothetical protein
VQQLGIRLLQQSQMVLCVVETIWQGWAMFLRILLNCMMLLQPQNGTFQQE